MSRPESADLQVDFLRGYHGDGYPFDGAGGAVGHAFFPSDPSRAGGVHLDAEEQWAFRQPGGGFTDIIRRYVEILRLWNHRVTKPELIDLLQPQLQQNLLSVLPKLILVTIC